MERKKEEAGSGDWQRPAQPCCRTEIPLLQHSLMRCSIRVKILIFTLRSENIEQEKQSDIGTNKKETGQERGSRYPLFS